jgi:TonB family protein
MAVTKEIVPMKHFAIAFLVLPFAACAASSTTRGTDVATEPSSGMHVDMTSDDAAPATFPARLNQPSTPRAADRLAPRVVAELGGEARADLRLCVGGDGSVTSAKIAHGTGIDELDAAFVSEAQSWRYEPLAAADKVACQKVEISYRVR